MQAKAVIEGHQPSVISYQEKQEKSLDRKVRKEGPPRTQRLPKPGQPFSAFHPVHFAFVVNVVVTEAAGLRSSLERNNSPPTRRPSNSRACAGKVFPDG